MNKGSTIITRYGPMVLVETRRVGMRCITTLLDENGKEWLVGHKPGKAITKVNSLIER